MGWNETATAPRMSGIDLELLQEKSLVEGLPYQTLMSSILHKDVTGNR